MTDDDQFLDAEEITPQSTTTPAYAAPAQPNLPRIDDPVEAEDTAAPAESLVWDDLAGEDDEEEEFWNEDEEEEEEMMRMGDVNDEDWEGAERDFSKAYNRLRQYHNVTTSSSNAATSAKVVGGATPLPALNRPKPKRAPPPPKEGAPAASGASATADSSHTTSTNTLSRLLNLDPYAPGPSVNRKAASERANQKDKADRATTEQVLDARTRLVLVKMINRGLIRKVEGCVSTGKEANVYHALPGLEPMPATASNPNPQPLPAHIALKIYKTSILIFKDRDRYVTGEHRFRNGYGKGNPRKMVRMWAEKEMRNLKRLANEGVRCPRPLEVRENVLAMEFLGDDEGWASPRLKDATDLDTNRIAELYAELLLIMRVMYQRCRLVHADLSEYNILYHEGHLVIIDVSQSVEHDHPASYDFLRMDIKNVSDYFRKRSGNAIRIMGARKTFEFLTRETLGGVERRKGGHVEGKGDEELEEWERVLREWIEAPEAGEEIDEEEEEKDEVPVKSQSEATLGEATAGLSVASLADDNDDGKIPTFDPLFRPTGGKDAKSKSKVSITTSSKIPMTLEEIDHAQDEAIFMASYIPRHLGEVYDPERDVERVQRGEGRDLIYARSGGVGIVGIEEDGVAGGEESDSEEEEGEEGSEEEAEDEEGKDGGFEKTAPRGKRHEDREAKKERKKALKEETREKRKEKMPKKEKKKKVAQTKR